MTYLFAAFRLAAAISGATAVIATFAYTAEKGPINPFNFFGFFTLQSNIFSVLVLGTAALVGLTGLAQSRALEVARGCVATYMIIVGVVYNTLLTGLDGGVLLPWANDILHIWIPLYLAADWILFGDRSTLAWKYFPAVLAYPVVWLTVVLIRGATDGWVPYPFLNPATGYGSVAIYAIVIAIAFALVGALVWALSRVRVLTPLAPAGRGQR